MITAAIEKILHLAKIEKVKIGNHEYAKPGLKRIEPPELFPPEALEINTLAGFRDYVSGARKERPGKPFVQVVSPKMVNYLTELFPENANIRHNYATAHCLQKGFAFGKWLDLEAFIIALQTLFVQTDTVENMMGMLASLANEQIVENKDDSFSQTIQIKSGITTKSAVKVENPIALAPYRTFREIEQPVSQFILRLRKPQDGEGLTCALFGADGDAWELEAIERIAFWLSKELPTARIIA